MRPTQRLPTHILRCHCMHALPAIDRCAVAQRGMSPGARRGLRALLMLVHAHLVALIGPGGYYICPSVEAYICLSTRGATAT